MLRLSKLTDYAIVILTSMVKDKSQIYTAASLATVTGIALPTVSKLLKVLLNAKILLSIRGAKGGYLLARTAEKISVADVITAIEGPIALTECSISHEGCEQSSGCELRGNWGLINLAIQQALASITLADMTYSAPILDEVYIPIASLYR